jgi:flagellin
MISINTNSAASAAAYNLGNTNTNLQRSLQKLSSGSRINSSFDDAGGLAVSMKLSASIRRTEATQSNLNNAISLLETQDGVLKSADKILSRMSELASLSLDVTKSSTDTALYQTEYDSLASQLDSMTGEKFNGIDLFGAAATLVVTSSHDGEQTVGITQADLATDVFDEVDGLALTDSATLTTITAALQNLATLRATNGSERFVSPLRQTCLP